MTTESSELQQTLRMTPEQLTVPIDLANMGFTTTAVPDTHLRAHANVLDIV